MRKKLFWLPCLMLLFGAVCASCGSDDNEPADDSGTGGTDGGTEVKGDYAATMKVKTVTLRSTSADANIPYEVTIYEDFNRKYDLRVATGQLCLFPYTRSSGSWRDGYVYYPSSSSPYYSYYSGYLTLEDMGKMNGIAGVTNKVEFKTTRTTIYPSFQPEHGYAAVFKTENDELKYLRIFVGGYTLTDAGGIATATLQYQLY